MAVMAWSPALRVEIVSMPEVLLLMSWWSTWNCIVPDGLAAPKNDKVEGTTAASKVTACPGAEGFAEENGKTSVDAFLIVKDCVTLGAALKLLSPACEAVTEQEPAPVRCTGLPKLLLTIVQLPIVLRLTARPDVAVASAPKSRFP